jgi:hypothetical protein
MRAMKLFICAVFAASLVAVNVGNAFAQEYKVPIPGYPIQPTSRDECRAMSAEWSKISSRLGEEHEVCINGQSCKGTRSGYKGSCQCGACQHIHTMRDRFSNGDMAQLRRQREQTCNETVAAYEAGQRRQRQAAENARREQERLAREAEQQYNDMLRRQRESQAAVTAQQLADQRRKLERLQAEQRQLAQGAQQAANVVERPQSIVGNIIYDTSRSYNSLVRAKDDVKTTIDILNVMFSGSHAVRREASTSLLERAQSTGVEIAAASAAQMIGSFVPRRNEYEDPRFNVFFEAAQNATTGRDTRTGPVVRVIQDTAANVLRSELQQTLGDIDQLQRDISGFSAGGSSYYSTGGSSRFSTLSPSSGGLARDSPSTSNGETSPRVPTAGGGATSKNVEGNVTRDLMDEEIESIREGLRAAMNETGVRSNSLMQIVGGGTKNAPSNSICSDQTGTSDGRAGDKECRGGNLLACREGRWQRAGSC